MPAYTPQPVDTSAIRLTAEQQALVEGLAGNAHDVWAAKRVADGWVWGEKRDDNKKHHPCLIPYDDLPDSEKAYDREIVEQTIKAALSLGYRISKPDA